MRIGGKKRYNNKNEYPMEELRFDNLAPSTSYIPLCMKEYLYNNKEKFSTVVETNYHYFDNDLQFAPIALLLDVVIGRINEITPDNEDAKVSKHRLVQRILSDVLNVDGSKFVYYTFERDLYNTLFSLYNAERDFVQLTQHIEQFNNNAFFKKTQKNEISQNAQYMVNLYSQLLNIANTRLKQILNNIKRCTRTEDLDNLDSFIDNVIEHNKKSISDYTELVEKHLNEDNHKALVDDCLSMAGKYLKIKNLLIERYDDINTNFVDGTLATKLINILKTFHKHKNDIDIDKFENHFYEDDVNHEVDNLAQWGWDLFNEPYREREEQKKQYPTTYEYRKHYYENFMDKLSEFYRTRIEALEKQNRSNEQIKNNFHQRFQSLYKHCKDYYQGVYGSEKEALEKKIKDRLQSFIEIGVEIEKIVGKKNFKIAKSSLKQSVFQDPKSLKKQLTESINETQETKLKLLESETEKSNLKTSISQIEESFEADAKKYKEQIRNLNTKNHSLAEALETSMNVQIKQKEEIAKYVSAMKTKDNEIKTSIAVIQQLRNEREDINREKDNNKKLAETARNIAAFAFPAFGGFTVVGILSVVEVIPSFMVGGSIFIGCGGVLLIAGVTSLIASTYFDKKNEVPAQQNGLQQGNGQGQGQGQDSRENGQNKENDDELGNSQDEEKDDTDERDDKDDEKEQDNRENGQNKENDDELDNSQDEGRDDTDERDDEDDKTYTNNGEENKNNQTSQERNKVENPYRRKRKNEDAQEEARDDNNSQQIDSRTRNNFNYKSNNNKIRSSVDYSNEQSLLSTAPVAGPV